MSERYVFPVTPGNADPMDIVVTYDWSRKPWEPSVYWYSGARLPRKLKQRLKAHVRRRQERELAMVARWWDARGSR